MDEIDEIRVEFKCHECVEIQNFDGSLEELLFNLRDSGWPICPECGEDMDMEVKDAYIMPPLF